MKTAMMHPMSLLGALRAAPLRVSLRVSMVTPFRTPLMPRCGLLPFTRTLSTTSFCQATINQIRRGSGPPRRRKVSESPDLERCPFKRGVVVRVMVLKPKKPNSAQRKACRVRLSNGKVVSAYIPGEGHNAQEHSIVYVRGGRCQDLPGVKYHLVRGAGDLGGVLNRISSRSKYGVKRPTKT